MARNRRGQHQRRPRLSLMGLAASTILIRSLSLKPTDWPLYLHEPSFCSTARPTPANIWPRGPSHTAQVTLANQRPMQRAPAEKPSLLFTYSFQPQPHGLLLFFCITQSFFSHFLGLNRYFFLFSLLSSLLFIWPT